MGTCLITTAHETRVDKKVNVNNTELGCCAVFATMGGCLIDKIVFGFVRCQQS